MTERDLPFIQKLMEWFTFFCCFCCDVGHLKNLMGPLRPHIMNARGHITFNGVVCIHLSHDTVRLKLKILVWRQRIYSHIQSPLLLDWNTNLTVSLCVRACVCWFGFYSIWCLNLKHFKWKKIVFGLFAYGKSECVSLLPSVSVCVCVQIYTRAKQCH